MAVRSVLAQRDAALQVVIVDDGSTDGTATRVRDIDPRISVVRRPVPAGVSAARNAGIDAADGEWIAFLDDDDLWAPEKLSRQLRTATEAGSVWGCSGSVTFEAGGRIIAGAPPPSSAEMASALPRRNRIPAGASNVVVRADALREAGPFDVELRHMADWHLWMRLGRLSPPAVVREPDVAYRQHAGNASLEAVALHREIARIESTTGSLRAGRSIDRAAVHRWSAWHLLRAGRRAAALRAYAAAVASGDIVSIARGVAAGLAPDRVVRAASRAGLDANWISRAESWLGPLLDSR